MWFSLRAPEVFPERGLAMALRQTCAAGAYTCPLVGSTLALPVKWGVHLAVV